MNDLIGSGIVIFVFFAMVDEIRYLRQVNAAKNPDQRENPVVNQFWHNLKRI